MTNPFEIPNNLEECYKSLSKILNENSYSDFASSKEEDLSQFHFGLGMWLRNNWGLWQTNRLTRYFNEMGIYHADDMSSIILTSYHRFINLKPINLESQIKEYQDFWAKQGIFKEEDFRK